MNEKVSGLALIPTANNRERQRNADSVMSHLKQLETLQIIPVGSSEFPIVSLLPASRLVWKSTDDVAYGELVFAGLTTTDVSML